MSGLKLSVRGASLAFLGLLLLPGLSLADESPTAEEVTDESPTAEEVTDEEAVEPPVVDSDAEVAPWVPGGGEETELTRKGADFLGMGFLFPVRLHLSRGGFLDGKIAGVDSEGSEFMLVLPRTQFRVHTSLVRAVTPRGELPEPGSPSALRRPPDLVSAQAVYKLRPTWRSGLGLVLNTLAPGTGTFIQREEKALGLLFLGLDVFFLSAGVLAAFAPSRLGDTERAFFGGIFFAFDALTRAVGAGQAFAAGRERTLVPIRVPGRTGGPGLAR